jgi:PAS domain S-box-containing protein
MQRKAGVRAAQSTPIVSRSGPTLGIFSTHYRQAQRPDAQALRLLDLLAREAADIIDRQRAETELERMRRLLAEGQRLAHLGSWEYVTATRTTIWSDEQKRIYGLNPDQPSPDYESMLRDHIHPDDAAELDRIFRAAFESRTAFENENRIVRPGGEVRWIYNKAQPYFDERGELLRYVGATLDITERKRSEEALREADRRKDEFLAMLAHELRNPLQPIKSGLDILRLGVDNVKAGQVRAMMARQVDHLVRLVDDLLEVSRVSRGRIELRKERIHLGQVVNDAVAASQSLMAEKEHRLTVSLAPEPLPLDADPTRLAQVVINLLNNAAKFTDPGGQIEISTRREGSEAVVSVRDNGAGIPGEQLTCVFELFTQLDNGVNQSRGGLGIGLALVRSLVTMHGGRVEARSKGAGHGSEFVVRLPVAAPSTAELPKEPATSAAEKGPAQRIVVVDDNWVIVDAFVMMLETMDTDVRVAYDGKSALETIAAFEPEVVFMDIGMPVMDGNETARRIRQLPHAENIFLVALTGWGREQDRHRSREAGFDKHLVKPVDFDEVQALLTDLRSKKALALTPSQV